METARFALGQHFPRASLGRGRPPWRASSRARARPYRADRRTEPDRPPLNCARAFILSLSVTPHHLSPFVAYKPAIGRRATRRKTITFRTRSSSTVLASRRSEVAARY